MPPTHPSQADVAAAYRTLIAHETEPKEQDFYRTRLQRVEQAAEPVCEFDCRSRVAAAGVGIYCPQCSAKSADTDLTTHLAIQQIEGEAAWWRSIDFDRNASRTFESMTGDSQQAVRTGVERVLAHLASTGRLIPAGGMALTAEQVEDVEALVATANPYSAPAARLRALFPATEPAEEVKPVHPKPDVGDWGYGGGAAVYAPEVRGKTREELLSEKVEQLQAQVKHLSRVAVNAAEHGIKAPSGSLKPCGYCHSTEATLLHACTNCGAMTSDPWSHPAPAEPAEEETKAEEVCTGSGGHRPYPCVLPDGHAGVHVDRRGLRWNSPASSPVVPAPTETGPWQRIEDVPVGVPFKDREGSGLVKLADSQFGYVDNYRETSKTLAEFAPFVAAAEEG